MKRIQQERRIVASTRVVIHVARSMCVVAVTFIAVTCPALSQAQTWYAGASAGSAELREDLVAQYFSATQGFDITQSRSDSRDSGWKLFAGYRITPQFSLEASYLDLGSTSMMVSLRQTGVGPFSSSHNAERKATAYGVDLVGTIPITGQLSALGRLGAARVATKRTGSGVSAVNPFLINDRDTRTVLRFGVGSQWNVTQLIGLRIEWERLRRTGSPFVAFRPSTGRSDVDLITVGCLVSF